MIQILSKNCFSDIGEFEIDKTKTIGKGSFGVVRLGIHKGTNKVYAIKIIQNNIEKEYQLKLIQRQINLHSSLNHPHIIKLWDTILNKNMVYLIMEYAQHGNLFHHQNTKYKFTQAETFKFFYQIAKAVEHMHDEDTIHRDIKPENILLDKHNNALLADFGWSAKGILDQRSTFCGTYQYMAPQMIAKQNYNYKVDVWSLGVLLYEMLHGNAPFTGQTLPQVQRKIQKGQYGIYAGLSFEAKSLIRDILQFNPLNRPPIKDILKHSWIKKMQSEINAIVKRQFIRSPECIDKIINKIVTQVQKRQSKAKFGHKKAQSAINMFGRQDPQKILGGVQLSQTQLNSKKIKKNKAMKTLGSDSVKKLISHRTESPFFQAKQNIQLQIKAKQGKIAKHRKQEHMRLMTEINNKLKYSSPNIMRTNPKTSQDNKRQSKRRSKLRQIID